LKNANKNPFAERMAGAESGKLQIKRAQFPIHLLQGLTEIVLFLQGDFGGNGVQEHSQCRNGSGKKDVFAGDFQ
jgi:hypothetical protein